MPAATLTTRLATLDDAAAIAEIYNQGIEERIATFETEPRSPDDIVAAIKERGEQFPTVVAERDGTLVAWASASLYRSRPCYAGIGEYSVYVHRAARGIGAGKVVLEALFRESEARGLWKLVSRISPRTSPASRSAGRPASSRSGSISATRSWKVSGRTA